MISKQQKQETVLLLLNGLLIAADTLIFSFVWYRFYSKILFIPFFAKGDYFVIALCMGTYVSMAKLYGGFDTTVNSAANLAYSHAVATVISGFFMYIILWLLIRVVFNVLPLLLILAGMMITGIVWSGFTRKVVHRLCPPKPTVLVFENAEAREDGAMILRDLPLSFRLCATASVSDGPEAVYSVLEDHKPEVVMLCGIHSSLRNDIVKYCIERNIEAYVRPTIGDFLIKGAMPLQLSNLPVLLCRRSSPSLLYLMIKRCMDIVLSLIALIVFSPFMITTAVAIKVYDHGPILYKQLRLTKDRKPFYVYKFRSMRVDAEKDGVARLASQNDDRITPIGKIIRSLRIDEMPQLFCILLGSMTIVGPRPERPEIAEQYEKEMPEFALRLQAKAGLTGYAQVYGKYNTTPYNKLQMDLQYIGNMSLVTDLKIIFATVKILFVPESTEGVAQGQTTAAKDNADK